MVQTEPAESYHADREFIGSTELRLMKHSPLHFYTGWKRNDDREVTEGMEVGTMLHSLLLEQDVERYIPRPVKDGRLVASNTKDYKAFLEANPGKTPIRPELHSCLYEALSAFTANKTAMKLIEKARIENSVRATDPASGVKVKCRPDVWGDGFIVDLKSVGQVGFEFFERTIFTSGYDFQLAHYAETIFAATGEVINSFYVLAFEQKAPFGMKLYRVPANYIEEQKAVRLGYLNEIKVCMDENRWPCYREEILTAERPHYLNQNQPLISF